MTFYSPSESRFTRSYRDDVEVAFSAMDCLLTREPAIYASTELTTGVRLYEALRHNGVRTAAELKDKMGPDWFASHVFVPNVAAGLEFAGAVRLAHEHRTPVITPGPFSAPGWTQIEYLAFWETLVRTRVRGVWFNTNWQFSTGCTFEFAVAQDAGLPTLDSTGRALEPGAAITLIGEAIHSLDAEGFDTIALRDNLQRLIATAQRHRTVVER